MAAHSPILNTCYNLLEYVLKRILKLHEALKTKLRKGLYSNRNNEAAVVSGGSLPVLLGLKENKKKKPSRAQSKK